MKKNFLRSFLLAATCLLGLGVFAQNTVNVVSDITSDRTWSHDSIYILYGDIIIKNGATLTIQPGTIIRGDKSTLSRIVVSTSGKINAVGTAEEPIVFTSNQPAGSRARADWAGITICGLAPVNFKDAGGNPIQGRVECGTTTDYDYGGSNPDDSSGVIKYVRIEYAGYVCGTNTELNSLTLCGVGRKTVISHVMTSYGQDDAFEFFGGTATADHLVSFGNRDDDLDTDNGWSGIINHALVVRVDTIADQGDISNGFESDNDANGSTNTPNTAGVFTNITIIGPAASTSSTIDAKYGWVGRLRRNTKVNVFNSVAIGYKRGLRIEGAAAQNNATNNDLEFKYNLIGGCKEAYGETAFDTAYLLNPANGNNVYGGNANDSVQLVSPYSYPYYDFRPQPGSPALSGANFSNPKLSSVTPTTYRGAFGANDFWVNCWGEFTPQDEDYSIPHLNYGYTASLAPSGPTTFCQGGSVDLTVTGGAIYLWSTGASTPSITVSNSGTYTVSVANSRGCIKTFTQVVTVNSNPSAPSITPSATSFCTGGNVTLSSSAANSYSWSNSTTTQQITVSNAGSYTVTITDANGCSAASNAVQITENTPQVPVIAAGGSTTFCTGGAVTLSVNNAGNYSSFNWSTGGTADTIAVTTTGTYTVTTTDNNSCTAVSNAITTNVSNSPTPTISANGAIAFCSGDSVTISSTSGDTYLWSTGATTQAIVVKQSGTYSVSVTNTDPCNGVGNSNTITVNVTPTPTASFTQAASGSSYTINFTDASTNATSYNWNFGDNQTSTSQNPTHTYTANGTYTVTLTASNGNCDDTHTMSITITGVGIKEVASVIETIRLFPNPNNGQVKLEINAIDATEAEVAITDMTGRVVMQNTEQLLSGNNLFTLNTAAFANGIYFVTVKNGAENKVVRMVVSK
ncbi:MAG: PKD domain-containing protein [Chitinophagales bacterium]